MAVIDPFPGNCCGHYGHLHRFSETLVSGGNRSKSASFGFTEPYLMGRPVSLGFQLFASKNQFLGDGYIGDSTTADPSTLFTQQTFGGSINLSGQLSMFTRKFEKFSRFTRVGLSYSLTSSRISDPKVNHDDNLDDRKSTRLNSSHL